MALDLVANSGCTFTTTTPRFGSAALDAAAVAHAVAAMPTNRTFRVRVSATMGSDGETRVVASAANMFWLGKDGSGFAKAEIGIGVTAVQITTTVAINNGVYHDYDLRVGPSGGQLYIDGVLVGSTATSATAAGVAATAADLYVGRLSGNSAYDWLGNIDEVALSSTIPAAGSYTPAVISNSESGLIAVWHLDSSLNDSASGTPAATAVTMTGPAGGVVNAASTNFTVGADGKITGTVVVTPSSGGGGGTFSPTTLSISAGSPTGAFTYTPATTGAKTISVANNGSLTNPSNITYTATAAPIYTRVDATDTLTGEAIMILVPASGATNPYNAASPTNVILHTHGAGEDQTALITDSLQSACVTALLNAGYILASTNGHGTNWGNQPCVDDLVALDQYVRANYNVAKVCIWSKSMGGLAGLSALASGRIKCVGWLGTYPATNLSNLYGIGTYTGQINTAYGISGTGLATYTNRTYGRDPALLQGLSFLHIPMRFYASTGDTVVPRANNTDVLAALVAGSCRESVVVACTGDHGDASHFDATSYAAFFARCFATPVASAGSLGPVIPATTKTVTFVVKNAAGVVQANLTGLRWKWSDVRGIVIGTGTGATTDASGLFLITVPSALATAQIGYLDWDNSTTGVIDTNYVAFSGPVAVS